MSDERPTQSGPNPPQPNAPYGGPTKVLANERPLVVVQQPGFLRSMMSWVGWLAAGLLLMTIVGLYTSKQEYFDNSGGLQEKYHSLSTTSTDNKIAIINVTGTIMTGDIVKKQIERVRDDKKVKAIVLRVDSPGGTVYGSDFIYHHLTKLREERDLPMVVSMGSMAASGGYYVAMAVGDQEKSIYAEPLTTTGSIGVIIPHYDVSDLMKEYGVKDNSIATHPRKQMLSMTRPLTEDDREVIGNYIGHAFDRFKEVIAEGRPKFAADAEALEVLATGEVFTAKQAKASGLIDEVGFIEDAIERALEMAGLNKQTTRVVSYKRPVTLMDALALGKAPKSFQQQLMQLNEPKAYYLASLQALWSANED